MTRRGEIFGFVPSCLSAAEIAATIAAPPRQPEQGPGLIVTANIDHVSRLRHDPAFAAAYAGAAIVTCDGFPVLWYAKRRGCAVSQRVTGCDIVAILLRGAALGRDHTLYFVADDASTAARLAEWATARGVAERTAIAVAPRRFQQRPDVQAALAENIRAHGATILLMGIGAPRSEVFVHNHRHLLPACWALCIGQALRVEMGLIPRAPVLWQRLNMEWLWRLVLEPRRLARRYAGATWGFVLAIALEIAPVRMLAAALGTLLGCTPVHVPSPQPAPAAHGQTHGVRLATESNARK